MCCVISLFLSVCLLFLFFFFFFNDTATTEIYTLSLHDALPISFAARTGALATWVPAFAERPYPSKRSEEHTSELQSQSNLVCRLLLEKKKKNRHVNIAKNNIRNMHDRYITSQLI